MSKMNPNNDQNSLGNPPIPDDEKENSKSTGSSEENVKILKEVGRTLSRIGDEFEESFASGSSSDWQKLANSGI